jgi:hypothetical protein
MNVRLRTWEYKNLMHCNNTCVSLTNVDGVNVTTLTTGSLHALRLDDTPYCTGARCAIINQLQLSIYLLLSIACKHARGKKAEYPVNKLSYNDTNIFFFRKYTVGKAPAVVIYYNIRI